ncbi:aquaporin [Pseudovibrio denitrificans]|uniref:aquaporin n=1 Tax=Pseudovibrio denitrificans TaxID=258256 RepID=UPI00116025E6|nr:aquaporin [Pseudovibrio denitrificans]
MGLWAAKRFPTADVIHYIIAIPISDASFNPARSTATAIVNGGWALEQLWMFWFAPIVGALVGARSAGSLAFVGLRTQIDKVVHSLNAARIKARMGWEV